MTTRYDFAIVGAGMAGASLAAALAPHGTVLLIEAEDRPGYHATGRSAAFWTESYGGPLVYPLTDASFDFLNDNAFLAPRGALTLARAGEEAGLADFIAEFTGLGVAVQPLTRAELDERIGGLRDEWTLGAYEPDCCDIDVAALHQHYLSEGTRHGVELNCKVGLEGAERTGGHWSITLSGGRMAEAAVLINAAGAWADDVAARCGVSPLGIQPYRRTMCQLRVGHDVPEDLPLTLAFDGSFYFRPEGARLWLSPHDEVPSQPCDAAPEEIDVATAIDRFERAVDWPVLALEHKWAGLRSFAPDRLPVYGFDPQANGFFWFAGQGGFGIQTAPAAADLALGLVLGQAGGTVDPQPYLPDRFR